MNVAAYVRVSTDKDDQLNSFNNQNDYFKEYINNRNGWNFVGVYCDEGLTGTMIKNRDGFNQMIEDAVSGKIDLILTKEVSRFARNTVDALYITRKLKKIGVGVYFLIDNINTLDGDGELRLTLMAALAQDESRKISERVKWGQKKQMEKGVVFGRSLLGYRVRKDKLYLVEEEAEIVRLIFHKYLNEGKGTFTIACELKEELNGNAKYYNWSNTQILRILSNEKYVGDLCQRKTYTKDFLEHKKYINSDEEMIYIKDHHPDIAIISRAMWNSTQAEIKKRKKNMELNSKFSSRYWASGKIYCGICGDKFVKKNKKTSVGYSGAWVCVNHAKAKTLRKNDCSPSTWISDRSLRYIIFYILHNIVDSEELKQDIYITLENFNDKNKKLDDLQLLVNKYECKKQKLIEIRIANEISQEDFLIKQKEIEEEIIKLKKKVNILKNNINSRDNIFCEVYNILDFNGEYEHLLRMVTESITIYKDNTVVVKLNDVSAKFVVKYNSTGKLNTYKTEILDFKIINNKL